MRRDPEARKIFSAVLRIAAGITQQVAHHGRMNPHTPHIPKREMHAPEAHSDRGLLTYAQKHAQANREAFYTVVALVATIVAWIVLGFGLSGIDVELFSTPLWVIGGTIGTWLFAIAATVVLAKVLFRDFDLDDPEIEERVADADAAPESAPSSCPSENHEEKGRSPFLMKAGDVRE